MNEQKPPKSILDDGYNPSPEHVERLEAELAPKVLEEERLRGEAIILSCMTPAERAILAGDDSIFFSGPIHVQRPTTPDKK